MCGIAGYSLSPASTVERTLAAQALLAGIAERGADAVGYGFRTRAGRSSAAEVSVTKLRGGASGLLDELELPEGTAEALLHVRDFTKGHPDVEANNHPIRHASVVGVHNGVIANDDDLLARYGIARWRPEMSVDSEAIFALMYRRRNNARALRELHGSLAAAWLDERQPGTLFLARGLSRPLWVGSTANETFFASTRRALAIVEAALRMRLDARPLREGRLIEVADGRVARIRRFRPDRRYSEPGPASPVHSPHEAVACLRQLASLAATA